MTQSDENPLQQIRDEADFIWQRVHANLPSGIVLERGQARSLTQDLSRVRELADLLQDREWRAQASIYLGYVFLRMDIGDAARNAEQAIAFVSEALETFTEEHHPREWAWACTTMGMLYNERYYQDQDRSNFEIAEAYLRDALRQRPREQFPVDWAFTASNLAESLRHSTDGRLTDNLDSRLSEAVELGRRAGAIFRGTNDHAEMGRQVDINTGVSLLQIVAQRISERRINHVRDHALPEVLLPSIDHSEAAYDELLDIVARIADLAELNPGALASERTPDWAQALIALKTPDNNELRMLDEVISLGQEAAHHAESSVVQARAYRLTADALEAKSGSSRETADLYQAALDHFGALHDPNFLAETGMKTGSTWVTLGDWNQASRAFQRTVATIDELYSSRRTLRVQEEDLARYPKLIEAAAYASVRCGQYVEAVRTLERGRARQATRAVLRAEPDIPKVREIDATLATELESCARQEASDRSAAARTDNVLRAIRKLPGLSTFGITADDDDLVSASSEERPLIYVVSTPSGTASLAISPGKPLIVELLDDTGVTSTQLVRFQYQIDIERQTASGILSRNESTLDDTLQRQSEELGEAFGAIVGEYLETLGAQSCALVLTGLLGSAPVSAAVVRRNGDGTTRRLIDISAIMLAPTAACLLGLQRRARRLQDSRGPYLGLGDAERGSRSLLHAEAELRRAASYFDDTRVAVGANATASFFLTNAHSAQEIHFACHGYTDYSDARQSYLQLADRKLTAADIYELSGLRARAAILSACESGQYGSLDTDANQVIGLGTAFIMAGATSVIVSLAQVNDLATYALISKYHESVQDHAGKIDCSALALRDAQLWLRDAGWTSTVRAATNFARSADLSQRRGLLEWIKRLNSASGSAGSSRRFLLRDWSQFMTIGL